MLSRDKNYDLCDSSLADVGNGPKYDISKTTKATVFGKAKGHARAKANLEEAGAYWPACLFSCNRLVSFKLPSNAAPSRAYGFLAWACCKIAHAILGGLKLIG